MAYLDLQRLYFCYVQRVEAINRFFLYIGGISDRHCLNLVLDVTKLYEIYFSHAFWLWEQHIVMKSGTCCLAKGHRRPLSKIIYARSVEYFNQ
jgi:hypothetical protein